MVMGQRTKPSLRPMRLSPRTQYAYAEHDLASYSVQRPEPPAREAVTPGSSCAHGSDRTLSEVNDDPGTQQQATDRPRTGSPFLGGDQQPKLPREGGTGGSKRSLPQAFLCTTTSTIIPPRIPFKVRPPGSGPAG